jgi:hypothetical protein
MTEEREWTMRFAVKIRGTMSLNLRAKSTDIITGSIV